MKCSDVFLVSIWSFPTERSETTWLKLRVLIKKLYNGRKKLVCKNQSLSLSDLVKIPSS